MKTVKKTKKDIEKAVRDMMEFEEGTNLFNLIVYALSQKKSVIVDAVVYIGNGRHEKKTKKNRYRYKMIVPIMDDMGNLYSTDLFNGEPKYAEKSSYEIYRHTRQLVVDVVYIVTPDYAAKRRGWGYKKNGFNKVILIEKA